MHWWIIHIKSRNVLKQKQKQQQQIRWIVILSPDTNKKTLLFWCCVHKQAIPASSSGIHGYNRLPCERDEGELMNLHDRPWLVSIESIAHESTAQDLRLSSKDSSVPGKLPLNASPAVLSWSKRIRSSSRTHLLTAAFHVAIFVLNELFLQLNFNKWSGNIVHQALI